MTRIKAALSLGGIVLLLVVGGVLGSSSREDHPTTRGLAMYESQSLTMEAPSPMFKVASASPKVQKTPEGPGEVADPKLIRTGEMSIEVRDYDQAMKELVRLVKEAGGYVASQSSSQGEREKRRGQVQLRLPATGFDGGLSSLKSLGKVRSESLNIQDVSKEYVDLQARLRVKQQTAQRMENLLRDRTAKLADVLAAEKELARVIEEIESLEGERRYYDHQAAYCTLELNLFEAEAFVEPSAFSPLSRLAERAVGILAASLAFLVSSLAFLTPWVLLGGLIWGLRRWLQRPTPAHS